MNPLLVMGIGLFVVFLGLFCLIGIIYLMSFIFNLASGTRKWQKKESRGLDLADTVKIPVVKPQSNEPAPMSPEQHRQFVAAVSAALAECMGTEPGALRIHSIRRVGAQQTSKAERRELVAVMAAAIAAELDTDVSGIRIHSIRRVG